MYGYLWRKRDASTVDIQLMVVSCKTIYNCILGRSSIVVLDTLASIIQLKMKYHNVHDKAVTICVDLEGAHGFHKVI